MTRHVKWGGTPQEVQPLLLAAIQEAVERGASAYLRFLACKTDSWFPVFGRVDLARTGDYQLGPRHIYKNIAALSEMLPGAEFYERIKLALTGEPFLCEGVQLERHSMHAGWGNSIHDAFKYCPWPTVVFNASASKYAPPVIEPPLAASGQPLFTDFDELRGLVTGFQDYVPGIDARAQNIHLMIWDYRGRIASLQYSSPSLRISLDGDDMSSMTLSGRVVSQAGLIRIDEPAKQELVRDISSEPKDIELALVKDDEVIDYLREGPYSHGPSRLTLVGRERPTDRDELTRTLLLGGESDRVEFKPWMGLGNPKMQELMETAIAFANTRGGTIIVGVDDHGEPLGGHGVYKALKHRRSGKMGPVRKESPDLSELREAIRLYGIEIKDFIQKNSNKTIPIEIASARVLELEVLILEIEKGPDRPYATAEPMNDVWVRVSATNRRASPYAIAEMSSRE
jgi:hypothetical protein